LFPNKERYQVVGWLTVYNSKNWPTLNVRSHALVSILMGRNAGDVQSVK